MGDGVRGLKPGGGPVSVRVGLLLMKRRGLVDSVGVGDVVGTETGVDGIGDGGDDNDGEEEGEGGEESV